MNMNEYEYTEYATVTDIKTDRHHTTALAA